MRITPTSKVISRVFLGTWRTPVSASSPETHTHGLAVNMEPPSFLLGMTSTWYGITGRQREEKWYVVFCVYVDKTLVISNNENEGRVAALTDGGKDIGKAEVVHSVKGQEVVEKLLFLVITAQEGVALVQFSIKKIDHECI